MPSNQSLSPVVLPARMHLRPDAFHNLEIAVLDMPYLSAINQFVGKLKRKLGRGFHWRHRPPYRLLNNTIAACTPTVVHGFENYSKNFRYGRRMLAIGRTDGRPSLQCVPEDDIADLVRVWLHHWGQSTAIRQYVESDLAGDWEILRQAVAEEPDTPWKRVDASVFTDGI